MKLAAHVACSLAITAVAAAGIAPETHAALTARAYGAWVNVPAYGATNAYVCDTGWLPTTGPVDQTATASAYVAGSALYMENGQARGRRGGGGCHDDDFAETLLGATTLMPGYVSETSFTALEHRRRDRCCDHDDDDYSAAIITDLVFAGGPVTVTGLPNQEIVVPGVGRLVINEIETRGRNGDDCDDDDFTVNALHLWPASGGEIIVASNTYDHDEDCCPTRARISSWGSLRLHYR